MSQLIPNRLKCIGGSLDGRTMPIMEYHRVKDIVNYPKNELSTISSSPYELPEKIEIEQYRVCCFHFSKDDIFYFLAHADWTDKEAILYQFKK